MKAPWVTLRSILHTHKGSTKLLLGMQVYFQGFQAVVF